MKTVEKIETHLDDIADCKWLFWSDDNDAFVVSEDFAKAAEIWGVSEKAVRDLHNSFQLLSEQLIGAIRKDLKDIWEKIEKGN